MNPFKILLLLFGAPRFLRDMPRPGSGRYAAQCLVASLFREQFVRREQVVNGRLRAYLAARWLAFAHDFNTYGLEGFEEIEIQWRITRLTA